ncbi:MAG: hypothetical protein K2V38_27245, partial [Gemmataceae bacterium]|nr:hypothetical protein [Gemmataceae bacterium]
MGFANRPRTGRPKLAVERLEDRTTPAKLADALLADAPAIGAVVGDRVNVVMVADTNTPADAARLAASPLAASVKPLGFGIYGVTLAPGADLTAAVSYYSALPGVQAAEPDQLVGLQLDPNDPSYNSTGLYGINKIAAPTAWDTTTGRAGFAVGVIDSGVDYTHPDLYQNIWINQKEIPAAVRSQLTDVDADGVITFRDLNDPRNVGPGKVADLNNNGYIDAGDLLKPAAQGGWADGTDADANGYRDD